MTTQDVFAALWRETSERLMQTRAILGTPIDTTESDPIKRLFARCQLPVHAQLRQLYQRKLDTEQAIRTLEDRIARGQRRMAHLAAENTAALGIITIDTDRCDRVCSAGCV